jgi:hypothetical protein
MAPLVRSDGDPTMPSFCTVSNPINNSLFLFTSNQVLSIVKSIGFLSSTVVCIRAIHQTTVEDKKPIDLTMDRT